VLAALPDHSYLSVVIDPTIRGKARATLLDAAGRRRPLNRDQARYVRVVEYDVPDRDGNGGHELFALVTNILDPREAPAVSLAGIYGQRWEHETGNGQVKTHLRGPGRVLRSKSPRLVEQEVWGYLLTHFAINALICTAATAAGIDPDRVTFKRTVRLVRRRVGDPSFPPDHHNRILRRVQADITRPGKLNTRRHRSYPRVIRRARHNSYPVRKPGQHGTRYDTPPTIRLARTLDTATVSLRVTIPTSYGGTAYGPAA